ncbi:LEM domain-containing protein 1 isoform X2 [Silurus meridionalis]|uniref:LEM domain-containing protein 1 isoform X2 n=1 Tax=Silurus meridionalis TaxID=175797 RepID=UPI001EEB1183|nr:LEM domain-containing protein 1 isoform X2 [Silurus meridionalis]
MPVFVENPSRFSKQRLKSELVSHGVELAPSEREKQAYLQVYMQHVANKSADFSSDEEEQGQNGHEEEKGGEDSDMVDLCSLTDNQLKHKLLRYGVKAGPIVASTRALYEKKLYRMMTQHLQNSVNSKDDAGKYSDSEEEKGEEEESGSELLGPESVSITDQSLNPSTVGLKYQSNETFYPQCFAPPMRQGKNQEGSLESLQSRSLSFSITQLVEEIENRLSPQSKSAETERSYSQTPLASRAQWFNRSPVNESLYLTPECLPLQKQPTTIEPAIESVTDVLMEMFPDTAMTPTGITATKRRSIKGAAGRPVQFKYPDTPLSPATLERQEIQQRLVPLWVQIVVFFLVVALLYVMYISMEEPLENPFSTLLSSLSQEPSSDDLALVPNSQDTHT